MKAQRVRLFDVLVLGPWLMYLGASGHAPRDVERALLFLAGLGTVLYNGRNYLLVARQATPLPPDDLMHILPVWGDSDGE